jgi:hypothetical protein
MNDFSSQLMSDIKGAMKAKNTVVLTTLRALKTAITNAAIESGHKDNVASEADTLALVRKQISPITKKPKLPSSKNTFPPPSEPMRSPPLCQPPWPRPEPPPAPTWARS